MTMNEEKYPSMSAQMFYDVQHFSDSLGCDRGPKIKEASFRYEGGTILHVKYTEEGIRALVIEILSNLLGNQRNIKIKGEAL